MIENKLLQMINRKIEKRNMQDFYLLKNEKKKKKSSGKKKKKNP